MQRIAHIIEGLKEHNIVLRGADLLSRGGFTQVPNHALENREISPGAKLAYAMLLKYAWNNDRCFPGQDRLATDMGVSRQTANVYIQELSRKKLIAIKRQGQGRPNVYELDLTVHSGRVRTRKATGTRRSDVGISDI